MGKLKEFLIRRVWSRIEGELAERWPQGWPRVRHALLGAKTLLGLLVLYSPQIVAEADRRIREAGLDPSEFLAALGSVLVTVGLIHKGLKLILPGELPPFAAGPPAELKPGGVLIGQPYYDAPVWKCVRIEADHYEQTFSGQTPAEAQRAAEQG